ncbi:hypothetical protein SRIMM317S_04980 [Streptomyces rimosus subsp. rimosus]
MLSGPADSPEIVADFHAMEPLDETAARAFDELREATLAVFAGTALEAGDLIIVDNRAAVHGLYSLPAPLRRAGPVAAALLRGRRPAPVPRHPGRRIPGVRATGAGERAMRGHDRLMPGQWGPLLPGR